MYHGNSIDDSVLQHEIRSDVSLVSNLVAHQFPQWADAAVREVESSGTDNAIFRLGDDLAVRLPRIPDAVDSLRRELHWLPWLSRYLPIPVPEPAGRGTPTEEFPYDWAVYRWIPGADLARTVDVDLDQVAVELAEWIAQLQRLETSGAPISRRAQPINPESEAVPVAIEELSADGLITDAASAAAVWEDAIKSPGWKSPPVWIHGDLHQGNMITADGKLAAVIDFGLIGIGDPACDMLPAWTLLSERTREIFRARIDVDDATWLRGRGWGMRFGLGALHVYRQSNPVFAGVGRHAIAEAIHDIQTRS
ncbi:aminoglycoside phosphotransferase family protein [Phytoactinopolyspora alkaliphila]|uniref:Aminoglycoside phosphotransferase family protein n=1 Tax=Phytoactinopolyspora alkaliphila TaxID=1783498 RepID=A0A6N9YJ31_9ACTN|nr:aminoglycoside phosphotransferase family protein [Phytoactinopolyspora alkaliphila]NED94908.1 aminoglycoside phosphotransferase family protein [Phytoactinopolyspora alkaliphila]